ncbi:argininosuccinate lyase [Chitinophaga sp. G-6-1-13]|uniref:Argininosuccinate lyase n=1 Tax=Chitinophaga fulva TaxID=2728842 RepID=A0A848GMJ5_9BACT|nr:argininosuccinate lyase [Chitinophaga fulva]NML38831.1 argininosuccinate lyase [Chitinophaga fulva]
MTTIGNYAGLVALTTCMALSCEVKAQMITANKHSMDTAGNSRLQDASRMGRTAGAKAAAFQELYDYEVSTKNLNDEIFPYQQLLHKAYVIMLAEQKIITAQEAKTILGGLATADQQAAANPALRVYLPYEAAVIKAIGSVGGKMHTGRSRNDMDNTTHRMYLRDQLLRIMEAVADLRSAVVAKAAEHKETVMVVYTHRKEAQPITLAHYLTGIDESLAKCLDRYQELYARIDQCPLGSGASGGTSWPINRQRLGDLLGFKGLVNNTIEGAAGWDHITEMAADNSIYMSNLSRLASEIQLWSTDEYNVAELDNSFAGISSMMPQKKNPDALERTRKAAALTAGQLAGILTSLNGIEYQHSGVRLMIEPKSLDAVLAATHTMTGVVRTLQVRKETMLKYARENYSTMTDLADLLVQYGHLDFRDAHEIVAAVITKALDEHLTASQITPAMINAAIEKKLGRKLMIPVARLADALDPQRSVQRKTGTGMPAPVAVEQMIVSGQKNLTAQTQWLKTQQAYLAAAVEQLQMLVGKY